MIKIVSLNDPLLALCSVAVPVPKELYVIGDSSSWLDKKKIVFVGTRKPTIYGTQVTKQLITALSGYDVCIISGLAYGIDILAHRTALENNTTTVAILPSGLNKIYPSAHAQIAKSITQHGGALISEYPPDYMPHRYDFVKRNRIVAALADMIIIPEATTKSGSMHTAVFGLEMGKTVGVVPGNITSIMSEGTNNLIKHGAVPITTIDDIINELGLSLKTRDRDIYLGQTDQEQKILMALQNGPLEQDDLQLVTGLSVPDCTQTLTMLEIGGYITAKAGKWYRL